MARKECSINGIRWISVQKPTHEDISFIADLFPFHPFVMESIAAPTLHPLVEYFKNHLFLILHFPLIERTTNPNHIVEIDCLITKDTLVTISYMAFERLEAIFEVAQKDPVIRKQLAHKHTDFLLYHIIDRLFQKQLEDLDYLEKEMTRIENKIFKKDDRLTIEQISHARKDILDFRRPINPQTAVLQSFIEKTKVFYGKKSMTPYWSDLLITEDRIKNLIENQKETMDVLYQTNESLLSSKLSRIIAVLTLFSAVILPLNLITSIWGMNQRVMPLQQGEYDFWIIVGIMVAVAALLLLFFRRKFWL